MTSQYTSINDFSRLSWLDGASLFYPCSGSDVATPVELFSPLVTDFWFVDTAYFRHCSPESERPILRRNLDYKLVDVDVHFPDLSEVEWKYDSRYDCKPPPIRTETYLHCSGKRISIHRHRRRGPSALRRQIDKMGVFFYRGDSDEGGSRTLWLTVRHWHTKRGRTRRWLIHEVLDKLINGGLLVTDGSMCQGEHNPYKEFRRFFGNREVDAAQAAGLAEPFEDDDGRRFCCIGHAGHHLANDKGPTLIWQVTHPVSWRRL